MRPLATIRRTKPFEPRVFEDPALWPLRRAARALGPIRDFPSHDDLARVFAGAPPVRFVPPIARARRGRRESIDVMSLYDARIAVDGVVPTRARCWHDLMNALVWGTFPRAKAALHARQHRLVVSRLAPGARTLPPRNREMDALAILDEGGVVVLASEPEHVERALRSGHGTLATLVAARIARGVVFGHAIYESTALGAPPAVVAALVLAGDLGATDVVAAADAALARVLADDVRLRSPREMVRVDARDAAVARAAS
jgi:hypothetical protein